MVRGSQPRTTTITAGNDNNYCGKRQQLLRKATTITAEKKFGEFKVCIVIFFTSKKLFFILVKCMKITYFQLKIENSLPKMVYFQEIF